MFGTIMLLIFSSCNYQHKATSKEFTVKSEIYRNTISDDNNPSLIKTQSLLLTISPCDNIKLNSHNYHDYIVTKIDKEEHFGVIYLNKRFDNGYTFYSWHIESGGSVYMFFNSDKLY